MSKMFNSMAPVSLNSQRTTETTQAVCIALPIHMLDVLIHQPRFCEDTLSPHTQQLATMALSSRESFPEGYLCCIDEGRSSYLSSLILTCHRSDFHRICMR